MEYIDCKGIEDLIFNQSFINWVLHRQPEACAYWDKWVEQHPEKLKLVNDAKAIIYALQINSKELSEAEINLEIKKILEKVKEQVSSEKYTAVFSTSAKRFFLHRPGKSLLLMLGLCILLSGGAWFVFRKPAALHTANSDSPYAAALQKQNLLTFTNNTDTVQLILLPDSSKVFLEKAGTLQYSAGFSTATRNVYLTGEAFFEVKRNTARPFIVFTKTITTKVLGTSFRVKAYDTGKEAVVTVKTGKVSVYKTTAFNAADAKEKELKAVLVTPNQQIVYVPETSGFTKSITTAPAVVAAALKNNFQFENTPVSLVFKALEEAYLIPISYDQEIIASCSLSANLGEDPFFEKLNIICRAIDASYEIIDGNIVITAKGCK